MRFCLEIGVEHPDFLELDCLQWADWLAFNQIEPFGERWKQTGQIAAAAHNSALLLHGLDEPTLKKLWRRAEDFMPRPAPKDRGKRREKQPPQTWQEQFARLRLVLRC